MNPLARRIAATCSSLIVLVAALAVSAAVRAQTAVEYYYQAWDHYFVTSFPDEIAVLDGGAFGGVWQRTGQTFAVWSQPGVGILPTCRFFSTAFAPRSSHFYTPFAAECETVKANPAWQYESIAYYLQLPGADATCPAGTVVLYRLYNNSMGGAPNHRYTTSVATFTQMQALGWIFEGDARTGAFACVPAPSGTAEGLWRATASGGRAVTIVVLDDGRYFIAYLGPANLLTEGGLLGVAVIADGGFSAPLHGRNVALRSDFAGGGRSVSGTYVPKQSLDVVIGGGATAETLNATYDPGYEVPVSLAAVAGTYKGGTGHAYLDWNPANVTIDASGRLRVIGGCNHAGRIAPRGSTGIFDLTLNNGCFPPGSPPQMGILVFDAARGTISAMAPMHDDDIVFVVGSRQ